MFKEPSKSLVKGQSSLVKTNQAISSFYVYDPMFSTKTKF